MVLGVGDKAVEFVDTVGSFHGDLGVVLKVKEATENLFNFQVDAVGGVHLVVGRI